MAKPLIAILENTDTFQDWLNKTNDLVNLFKDETLTASSGVGDTTVGNAILDGNLTANNLTILNDLNVDNIVVSTGVQIGVNAPLLVQPAGQVGAIFVNAAGGRTQYISNSLTWDVGIHNNTNNNFVLNTGAGEFKFTLTPSGELTVPSLVVTGDTDLGLTTAEVAEDASALYFTDERGVAAAQLAFSAGDNISFGAPVGGVIPINADGGADADTLGGLSSTQFLRSDQSGTLTGNLTITGDITSNGSASDISLKENIEIISGAGEKLSQLNGYTFNYKDNPDERMVGVIAQELENVLPEAVYIYDVDENGNKLKAVRYGNIVGLLIEAIKELQIKVDELGK